MQNDPNRWYARPVFFVGDVHRAVEFYVGKLGFQKRWHEGGGSGTVCQVDRAGCELILCENSERAGRGRLFVELTPEGLEALRAELAAGSTPHEKAWWGYDVIRVADADGNELLFPFPG